MAQPGQNPRDSIYDPFTYMMFGQQRPPAAPPQAFYQNSPQQASGMQGPKSQSSFLKPFMDQNGHMDVGKMMNGATHLVSVLNQTAPAFKQLSPLLKFFKRP